MSAAQVTDAHRALTESVCELLDSEEMVGPSPAERAAQLIADSEAKAVEAERARLYGIGRKKGEQPVSSDMDIGHRCLSGDKWPQPVDPIAECARLGRELADSIAERDQLRAELQRLDHEKPWLTETRLTAIAQRMRAEKAECECLNLRADLDAIKAIRDEEKARAASAEREVERLKEYSANLENDVKYLTQGVPEGDPLFLAVARAERAEAELKAERAIVSRIWVQLGSPTYEQLKGRSIYCLIDELKAELAAERARVADLVADLNDACITLASAAEDCDDYAMQNTGFKLTAVREVLLQHIPNAAMKEGA